MKKVKIKKDFFFSNFEEIKFILGPCQIESRSHALDICSGCSIDTSPRGKSKASDHTPILIEIDNN